MTDFASERELRLEIARLSAIVGELRSEIELQRGEISRLQAENARLIEQLDALVRSKGGPGGNGNAGHTAPFARRKRKENPKRPGRRPGEGPFTRREAPTLAEPIVEVPAPCECPECGGAIEPVRAEEVSNTDLPEPKPRVRTFRVHTGRCRNCGHTVKGTHPEVAPDQTGATAHRVTANVHGFAIVLRHEIGLPVRRIAALFSYLGVPITHSALLQFIATQCKPGKPLRKAHDQLGDELRTAPAIHTDDTGWRLTQEPSQQAWVMGFQSTGDAASDPQVSYFQIRPQHRNEEVREAIGDDYAGILGTDRFRSYDALPGVRQQKCHAHVGRNVKETLEKQHPGARSFGCSLLSLLRDARDLWRQHHDSEIDRATYDLRAGPLIERLDHLLRERQLADADNQRLLDGLRWHHANGSLLRFLEDPRIEPTNNRAERLLRRVVIARKTSQCSRTSRGAHAYAVCASVVGTIVQRAAEPVQALVTLLRGGSLPAPSHAR